MEKNTVNLSALALQADIISTKVLSKEDMLMEDLEAAQLFDALVVDSVDGLDMLDEKLTAKNMVDALLSADPLVRDHWMKRVQKFKVEEQTLTAGTFNLSPFIKSYGEISFANMFAKPVFSVYTKGSTIKPLDDIRELTAADIRILSELVYSDSIVSDPTDSDKYGFNIMQEGQKSMALGLVELENQKALYGWTNDTATGSMALTTGAVRKNIHDLETAKAVTDGDFLDALKYFGIKNRNITGIKCVVSPTLHIDILKLIKDQGYHDILTDEAKKRGVVSIYRGFEIIVSNYMPQFSDGTTKKAFGAGSLNTDREAMLFFAPSEVGFGTAGLTKYKGEGINYLAKDGIVRISEYISGATINALEADNTIDGIYIIVEGAGI